MKKIINIIISGILAILTLIVMISFIGLIQWLAAEFIFVKIVGISIVSIVFLVCLGAVWTGIYNYFKERQDIKDYINKNE